MTRGIENYAYRVDLNESYEQALDLVAQALKEQGFGVLTQIDVRDTMKQKLGVDSQSYAILGACNPQLAHRALTAEPDLGLLLPCNIVVREHDGGSQVLVLDPISMLDVVDNPELEPVATEARARLSRVADWLREHEREA